MHLFSGAPGAGKTALTVWLLKQLVTGEPVFGMPTRRPANVGFIAADRRWTSHQKWFDAAGLPDIPYYSVADDEETSGARLRNRRGDRHEFFKSCVAKLFPDGPGLPPDTFLVVDPVSLFLGGNPLDYDRVYTYMLDLSQFCIRHGCTILGLAHTAKQKGEAHQRYTRPQDRILGTTSQTGCAGTTFHLAPPTETEEDWFEFVWVPHHAPAGAVRLERDEATGLFVETSAVAPTRQETKMQVNEQRLLDQMPKDGLAITTKDLYVRVQLVHGWSRKTLFRVLAQAKKDGYVELVEKGIWRRALTPSA